MLCIECDKRNICTELCGAADKYADQDKPNYHKPGEGVHFTPMEKKVLDGLARGKTREGIAKALKITRKQLKDHIYNLRQKRRLIVL